MPAADPAGRLTLRARYTKCGKVRFTSHRDVVRMWERALRRSGLPVAWSEGFSPRPLISFGLALPTGAESLAEFLDLELHPEPDLELDLARGARRSGELRLGRLREIARELSALLPDGVDVQALAVLPVGSPSLQQEVSSVSWKLEVHGLAKDELSTRVERLLEASSVLVERERKGRSELDDIRPSLLALSTTPLLEPSVVVPAGGSTVLLDAELATRPRGVRPRELLEGLGPGIDLVRACRARQWIESDGVRREPLEVGLHGTAAVEAPAGERAS